METIGKYKRYPSFATSSSACGRKTSNLEFFVATVYHSPNPEYNQYDLIEILVDSVKKLLSINPNSKIIIASCVNQLDIKILINHAPITRHISHKCTTLLEENQWK